MNKLATQIVIGTAMVAVAVAIVIGLTSCSADPNIESQPYMRVDANSQLRVIKFEGHEYIAFSTARGGSLCHSESCPCK